MYVASGIGAPSAASLALRVAPYEDVGRRLKVDDEIGRRDVAREKLVEPLIDEQLVVVEVEVGEDLVLVEEVVGDRRLRKKIALTERICWRWRFSR